MMFVVNLAYLNASNGMFWYAVDKIRSLGEDQAQCLVLVGEALVPITRRALPQVCVESATRLGAWRRILALRVRRGTSLRTVSFTSHPIPLLGGQTIAFYDDYPFKRGVAARLKRLLFIAAARTSGTRIGIINRSLALPFLRDCGIAADRVFFDSAFPAVDTTAVPARSATPGTPLRVGLVGTDSLKKDYAAIFGVVRALGIVGDVRFLLYGAQNDYTAQLRRDFPDIDQQVLASDDVDVPMFFGMIDYLISASVAEGYGRPMGLAAMLGVPMFLLRSPVFLEFFGDHARFFDSIEAMMRHLATMRPPSAITGSTALAEKPGRSPFFA